MVASILRSTKDMLADMLRKERIIVVQDSQNEAEMIKDRVNLFFDVQNSNLIRYRCKLTYGDTRVF